MCLINALFIYFIKILRPIVVRPKAVHLTGCRPKARKAENIFFTLFNSYLLFSFYCVGKPLYSIFLMTEC